MARYFFHTDTQTRTSDELGIELSSAMEARRQAIQTSGQILADCPEAFWNSRPWKVIVTNEAGLILWELQMDGLASAAAPTE